MNREVVINLFKKVARILEDDKQYEWLADEVKDYLNEIYVNKAFEPEQEPVTDKPTETAMAVMPNGVCVSNVYDAYEEGRKSVMSEQEPVAWCQMVEGKVQDLLTSFEMKDWLYDKSWIPLYTAPLKREPLTPQQISEGNQSMLNVTREAFKQGVIFAEKVHGIGGGNEFI